MGKIAGGVSVHEAEIMFAVVKCPVQGCSFECSSFGELNVHMRKQHAGELRSDEAVLMQTEDGFIGAAKRDKSVN